MEGVLYKWTNYMTEITDKAESLKTKMSELRLYCDLLMQQVHTIQESEDQEGDHSNSSSETLNEASSLLSATCYTFIKTLEECMKMAKFKTDMALLNPPDDMMMSPVSPSSIQMARVGWYSTYCLAPG
uniref:Uncharacterized protein n=1 Tax=Oncorhynchus tshawytscha TaxID=74940 RepID=A0AAZ3QEU1_ONCTS